MFTGSAPGAHQVGALARAAEPVVLELDEHERGEGVVELGDVDVARADARLIPEPTAALGGAASGEVGAVVREQGVARTPDRTRDRHRHLSQIARTLRGRDHQRDRGVGLEATVEQPQRLHDPARREVVVHRERRSHERSLVHLRVATLGDRNRTEVLGAGAVLVEVRAADHRELLRWCRVAVRNLVLELELVGRRPAGAAHAELGARVHRSPAHDAVGLAGDDGHRGGADDRV